MNLVLYIQKHYLKEGAHKSKLWRSSKWGRFCITTQNAEKNNTSK